MTVALTSFSIMVKIFFLSLAAMHDKKYEKRRSPPAWPTNFFVLSSISSRKYPFSPRCCDLTPNIWWTLNQTTKLHLSRPLYSFTEASITMEKINYIPFNRAASLSVFEHRMSQ